MINIKILILSPHADDAAFSLLLLKIIEIDSVPEPSITIIPTNPLFNPWGLGEPYHPLSMNTIY